MAKERSGWMRGLRGCKDEGRVFEVSGTYGIYRDAEIMWFYEQRSNLDRRRVNATQARTHTHYNPTVAFP
jgi:hypothetical protein